MKFYAYVVLDRKSNVGTLPMFLRNDIEAIRAFDNIVNRPDTNINKYPQDYDLVCIGGYDDELAVLIFEERRFMYSAVDFYKPQASGGLVTPENAASHTAGVKEG